MSKFQKTPPAGSPLCSLKGFMKLKKPPPADSLFYFLKGIIRFQTEGKQLILGPPAALEILGKHCVNHTFSRCGFPPQKRYELLLFPHAFLGKGMEIP